MVKATPRLLYPRERPGNHRDLVGFTAGLNQWEKSRPIGIRSLDRPARSESLYRLSYPGQAECTKINLRQQAASFVNVNIYITGVRAYEVFVNSIYIQDPPKTMYTQFNERKL